jgi:hypothetical protein
MPTCPICKKENQDLVKHLHVSHEISDTERSQELLAKAEKIDLRKREFRNFVRQLQDQRQGGSISVKQFRESLTKWLQEHEAELFQV